MCVTRLPDVDFGGHRRKSRSITTAIESNLATKKCIADALFLSGSRASCKNPSIFGEDMNKSLGTYFLAHPVAYNRLSVLLVSRYNARWRQRCSIQ